MKRFSLVVLMLFCIAGTTFAEAHREMYSIPCSTLWPAVKDTLRNSGEYRLIWLDNSELAASFAVGGQGNALRINAVVLDAKGDNCEMQIQTGWGAGLTNDSGDLKRRVDSALAKLTPAPASKPEPSSK